jgi:tetratricopeptide (TPR) repeat protein
VQNARPNGAWDRLAAEPARAGVPPSGEEAYFTGKTIARAKADASGFAQVVLSKLAWLTQAEEPRDNHAYAFFAAQSGILRMLPGFGLLLALAVASMPAALQVRRVALPLLWIVAASIPPLVALAGLRYRMPVVPPLALFAGTGAVLLLDRARLRDPRILVAPAALAALTLFSSHIRRHPPSHVFSEEWSLEGNAWMELGKPAEAERALRRALEEDPKAALPVEFLGRLRLAQGRAAEAADTFEESLRMDPDSRSAHFFLGQAREAMGRWSDAASAYRDALAISPDFFPALYHLGRALVVAGEPAAAVPELERAVALQPSEQPPRDLLARARELAAAAPR